MSKKRNNPFGQHRETYDDIRWGKKRCNRLLPHNQKNKFGKKPTKYNLGCKQVNTSKSVNANKSTNQ